MEHFSFPNGSLGEDLVMGSRTFFSFCFYILTYHRLSETGFSSSSTHLSVCPREPRAKDKVHRIYLKLPIGPDNTQQTNHRST